MENTEVTPIGKGLWETATEGPTEFRIFVADPVAGQIGFIGVIGENNKSTILGARLKVINGKITEIDHLVVHSCDQPLNTNMEKPRPGLLQPLEPSERIPHEEMLEIANLYYEAIVQDNGDIAPFADECQRRENGSITTNDQEQTPEKAREDDFSVYRKMKCSEPKVMKITGVPGITERANIWGAFDLPAAHIFKIRNGKISDIEAIGYMAEHGITNGWNN